MNVSVLIFAKDMNILKRRFSSCTVMHIPLLGVLTGWAEEEGHTTVYIRDVV